METKPTILSEAILVLSIEKSKLLDTLRELKLLAENPQTGQYIFCESLEERIINLDYAIRLLNQNDKEINNG